jgi:hypothetical protein
MRDGFALVPTAAPAMTPRAAVSVEPPAAVRPSCFRRKCVVIGLAGMFGLCILALLLFMHAEGILQQHVAAYIFSGYCAILAVIISFVEVLMHIRNYTNPNQQKLIIRILLMVPLFAMQSWLALRFQHLALYMELARDSYESFVIYTFFSLLLVYMDGEERCVDMLSKQTPMRFLPPLCCMGTFRLGSAFLTTLRVCLLQYVVIKPLCSVLAMVLHPLGLFNEGAILNIHDAYLWIVIILNISVTCAFSALIYFYLATRTLIKQHKPTGKFICVKIVVFLSFWQSVLVALLIKVNFIKATVQWNVHEVGMGLQDFLICIEMLCVAIAHRWVFSYKPFIPPEGAAPQPTITANLAQAMHPLNMVRDVVNEFSSLLATSPSPAPPIRGE